MPLLLSIFTIIIIVCITSVVIIKQNCKEQLSWAYKKGFDDGMKAGKKKALRRARRYDIEVYQTLRKLLVD